MGENTKIEWAHHSFSTHWGCVEVAGSRACGKCYAKALSHRWGYDLWGKDKPRRFFSQAHWDEPLKWDRKARAAGARHRVFSVSMGDIFEDRRDLDETRLRLFALTRLTPNLDWLLLTKRTDRILDLVPPEWRTDWPQNVWMGTTAEDNRWYRERMGHLKKVPAPVRFLSMEPLFEDVDLGLSAGEPAPMDWIISGCESGAGAAKSERAWFRSLRDQCVTAGISFFLKQMRLGRRVIGTPKLDGKRWTEIPTPRKVGIPVSV